MNTNADHVKHLTPALQQRLEQGVQLFKQNWHQGLMAETLGQITTDHPLRYPSLVEMTWVDMGQRFKQGQRITIEDYLEDYPELGSVHTISVDLMRLEYKLRKLSGDRVEVEEYARRFPNQYQEFLQRTRYADKGEAGHARPSSAKPLSEVAAAFGAASPVAAAFGAPTPAPIARKARPAEPAPVVVVFGAPAPVAAAAPTKPKRRARWPWLVGAPLFLLLAAFLGWMSAKGGFRDPMKFFADLRSTLTGSTSGQAGDSVQSLTVKLDVGAGEAVQEPIYLDLGLGFPLWLVSGGSPPPVTFGAVPQQTTASGKLPANSSTTFTFFATGEPGQDVLQTTPQLLSGVKVGDIRRVGFASLAQEDWQLTGYEIQVNGQPFHSAKGLKVRPKQLQEEAMKKLADLNQQGRPTDKERADLRQLVQTGLASDAEKARLKELEQQTSAGQATEEKTRLERQLRGQSPWYVETVPSAAAKVATGPRNPFDLLTPRAYAQAPAAPRDVRVTVVTDASHDKSGTNNYVYVIVGSHKYLIGRPLTSDNGPQTFVLDLLAGPLNPSELLGWGLGMLATPENRSKGPERWHPRRVQIEVDGKTVYDSEENATDRQTLAAIRIVPPCQIDLDGSVVKNPSSSRELYMWQAGKATGFDPGTGAVDKLPPGTVTTGTGDKVDPQDVVKMPNETKDPNRPDKPTIPFNPDKPVDLAKAADLIIPTNPDDPRKALLPKDPPLISPDALNSGTTPLSPQAPGGDPLNPLLVPEPNQFGETPNVNPINGGNPINGDNPFNPGSGGPLPPQQVLAGPIIIQFPSPLPSLFPSPQPGTTPPLAPTPSNPAPPAGTPFQIDRVNFDSLSRIGSFCSVFISWEIPFDADDSGVLHYEVSLMCLKEDLSSPGRTLRLDSKVPKGNRSLTRTNIPSGDILPWRFVLPVVRPVMDPKATAQTKFGPARSTASLQPAHVKATLAGSLPLQIQGPTLAIERRPEFKTLTAFDMTYSPENPALVSGLVVPLVDVPQTPEVRLSLTASNFGGAAPATIRFYTGFSGGRADGNRMEYRVEAFATEKPAFAGASPTTVILDTVTVASSPAKTADDYFIVEGAQRRMHHVTVTIPTLPKPRVWTTIELTIAMRNFTGDPTFRPVVFDVSVTGPAATGGSLGSLAGGPGGGGSPLGALVGGGGPVGPGPVGPVGPGGTVAVPSVTGSNAATAKLALAGQKLNFVSNPTNPPAGSLATGQSPAVGSMMPQGTVVTVTFGGAGAPPPVGANGLTSAEIQEILDMHNATRRIAAASFNQEMKKTNSAWVDIVIPDVTWDTGLAASAKVWSATQAPPGTFNHDSSLSTGNPAVDKGENMAWGGPPPNAVKALVQMWIDERTPSYVSGSTSWAAETPGQKPSVRHYTQMIWATTTKIGAGKTVDSSGKAILVCRYFPAGNFTFAGTPQVPETGK